MHEVCHLKRYLYAAGSEIGKKTPEYIFNTYVSYDCKEMGNFFEI